MSTINKIATTPFDDQCPGTSGLRKKTAVFEKTPHYLENFIQALFDTIGATGKSFVIGGDGRYYNNVAIQTIIKMAVANGVRQLFIGQNGLFSTPAVSVVIRKYKTNGGIILSASHNPAGPDGDFGIKYDTADGAPAPTQLTNAIYEETKRLTSFQIAQIPDVDLSEQTNFTIGTMFVTVMNPVADYAELMARLFDFEAMRKLFQSGFRMTFDAMNAVTGPYAIEILERQLGARKGTVINREPLPDFGGLHADPNLTYAQALVKKMKAKNAPDFGAASDGDGDRNMILGKGGFFVNPSDSIAIMTANARFVKGYAKKIKGVARSMPTSRALDMVAEKMRVKLYETPTGWKYFCALMDAGKVTLCGEESFGAGSNAIREKDGLWAVLFWLNIIAKKHQSVEDIVRMHWKTFGRNYFMRCDFEGVDPIAAQDVLNGLRARRKELKGHRVGNFFVTNIARYIYTDPLTHQKTMHQGIQVFFRDARAIFRLSGTGTNGATLRMYLDLYERRRRDLETQFALSDLLSSALTISNLKALIGTDVPTVVT